MAGEGRAEATRRAWLETIERHRHDRDRPGSARYWSPTLDTASRDELRAIQDAKVAAVTPFLYENSAFYRRRFDRIGLLPSEASTTSSANGRCSTKPRWSRTLPPIRPMAPSLR
jgi:phenylacetate-CoA ligase